MVHSCFASALTTCCMLGLCREQQQHQQMQRVIAKHLWQIKLDISPHSLELGPVHAAETTSVVAWASTRK